MPLTSDQVDKILERIQNDEVNIESPEIKKLFASSLDPKQYEKLIQFTLYEARTQLLPDSKDMRSNEFEINNDDYEEILKALVNKLVQKELNKFKIENIFSSYLKSKEDFITACRENKLSIFSCNPNFLQYLSDETWRLMLNEKNKTTEIKEHYGDDSGSDKDVPSSDVEGDNENDKGSGSEVNTSDVSYTSAPDTSAPDTSAPDTSAPDTSAPDTSAPETEETESKKTNDFRSLLRLEELKNIDPKANQDDFRKAYAFLDAARRVTKNGHDLKSVIEEFNYFLKIENINALEGIKPNQELRKAFEESFEALDKKRFELRKTNAGLKEEKDTSVILEIMKAGQITKQEFKTIVGNVFGKVTDTDIKEVKHKKSIFKTHSCKLPNKGTFVREQIDANRVKMTISGTKDSVDAQLQKIAKAAFSEMSLKGFTHKDNNGQEVCTAPYQVLKVDMGATKRKKFIDAFATAKDKINGETKEGYAERKLLELAKEYFFNVGFKNLTATQRATSANETVEVVSSSDNLAPTPTMGKAPTEVLPVETNPSNGAKGVKPENKVNLEEAAGLGESNSDVENADKKPSQPKRTSSIINKIRNGVVGFFKDSGDKGPNAKTGATPVNTDSDADISVTINKT